MEIEHSARFLREWSAVAAVLPDAARDRLAAFRMRAARPLFKIADLAEFCSLEECDELIAIINQAKSTPAAEGRLKGYARAKARNARRQKELTRQEQEIGPLPEVEDVARREACRYDPLRFLKEYCAPAFPLEFGKNHLELIEKARLCVLNRELMALAMPRGSGKTTICELLCLWAVLYGHQRFILFVHANEEKSIEALSHIREEIEMNELLLADFPEVCYPVRRLEGKQNKTKGQVLNGLPTRIIWKDQQIRLPDVPGSQSAGIVIVSAGIGSAVRGANKRDFLGRRLRPTFILLDDPQTDASARSREECTSRLKIITNGLMGCFGPDDKPAGLVPCTVIEKGDVADTLLNRELHPAFHGVRYRMLYGQTKRLDLWMQYWDLLKTAQKADKAPTEAYDLFVTHRVEMEAGMEAGWDARKLGRISAIQFAMELWLEDPEYFFREMQNDPQDAVQSEERFLRSDDIAKKVNAYGRGVAAQWVSTVTAHIDIQGKMLFYMVCGWGNDFTGQILEYGTWPEQKLSHFTARHAQPTMQEALAGLGHAKASLEVEIYQALDQLFRQLASSQYKRIDGVVLRPHLIGVDANNWKKVACQACVESPFAAGLLPMEGTYYGPNETPISQFRQQPGETIGDEWLIKARGGVQLAKFDLNIWKTFVGRRLATPHPVPGNLTIYGPEGTRHHLLGRHLDSEIRKPTTGERTIDEWHIRPGETENHWWDNLVGCAVLASMRGCRITNSVVQIAPDRPRLEVTFGGWPSVSA